MCSVHVGVYCMCVLCTFVFVMYLRETVRYITIYLICTIQVTQKNVNNIDMLSFWLANVCRLFHNLKQYSGDEVHV